MIDWPPANICQSSAATWDDMLPAAMIWVMDIGWGRFCQPCQPHQAPGSLYARTPVS